MNNSKKSPVHEERRVSMGYASKREDTSVRRARDDKPAVLIYEGPSGARVLAAISLESSVVRPGTIRNDDELP